MPILLRPIQSLLLLFKVVSPYAEVSFVVNGFANRCRVLTDFCSRYARRTGDAKYVIAG